ncbi:WD repeat-containing protein 89-like [Oopsacas minuta]|uniref:WD repeat-containing protein 89 n=1 Tax=Oopsacas minuta TaxID=111878 RepID=A0AAV7JV29_9METZ|nr:WD repeat-containing protein 89-like [Oopsacas minuta]
MANNIVNTISNPLNCDNSSYELAEQRLFSLNSKIYPLKFKANEVNLEANLSNVLITTSAENVLKCIDVNTLVVMAVLTGHNDIVTDACFTKTNPFIAWSSGLDGTVRCWDLRTNLNEITLQSLDEDKLLSVSLSLDDQLISSGSESIEHDEEGTKANLYIWDIKMKDYYQVYTDVYAESIDHVVFHPNSKNLLLSGCRDGLVYLFDVRENQNEACQYVLNTEAGISKIHFFDSKLNNIYCITDEGNIFLWESTEGNELCKYLKTTLGKDIDDVIDCFYDEKSEKLLAAVGNEKGEVKILTLNENGGYTPVLSLQNGHQTDVRAIYCNFANEKIITSCEDGMISLWKPNLCQTREN